MPLKKLTDIGADYAGWADGGKTITWAVGSSFFRLPFDSVVFDAAQEPKTLENGEDKDEGRRRKEGAEAQARGDGRRGRAAAAAARAARSSSAAPRSSRCGPTRSFPKARSS